MKFTEKQRKQIRRIIESIYLNVCQDSMIDEIQSVLSSLPAPTQDGTAEEFMDQWSNHNSWRSKGGIHKMITAYAAPLRAEIERLKLEEITNSTDLQTQYDRIKYLHSELTAANQRVKDLEDTILWALGYIGSFPERKEGQGLYWWRTELDRRSNIKPK